jgi:hypothetical protein
MTNQTLVLGATVKRSSDGITFTDIAECKSLAIPMIESDYQEATSLDSTGGFKEYVRGLKDAGVISVDDGYTTAGHEQQLADSLSATPIHYQTTLKAQPGQSTGDVFSFLAYPSVGVEGASVGEIVMMKISLRTTGNVAWTKGAAA